MKTFWCTLPLHAAVNGINIKLVSQPILQYCYEKKVYYYHPTNFPKTNSRYGGAAHTAVHVSEEI